MFEGGEDLERKRKTTVAEQPDIPPPDLSKFIKSMLHEVKEGEEQRQDEIAEDSDSDQLIEDEDIIRHETKRLDKRMTIFYK